MMMKLNRRSVLSIIKSCVNNRNLSRHYSANVTKSLVRLDQRTLLRVAGDDVSDFLQGLITNDIRHLKEGAVSIYSVFLSTKGRILYDTIIYKAKEDDLFYLECDVSIVNNLLKHLKMYKLRKKVNIDKMEESMKVWVAYEKNLLPTKEASDLEKNSNLEARIFPCGSNDQNSSKEVDNISMYSDPRITELGLRILTESSVTSDKIIQHLKPCIVTQENSSDYRAFRYKLGIAEGVNDLPSGVSFPLEANCDYLHGISFHKGCYIGQELTARTYHTGVVRKRFMPLILEDMYHDEALEFDDKILNESEKIVGKLVGKEGCNALGLIRITEALASKTLTVRNCVIKVVKPHWWPQETQKQEASLKSNKN